MRTAPSHSETRHRDPRNAKAASKTDGAMPQMSDTVTISDGIPKGTPGMTHGLVSREVIADPIETVCQTAVWTACRWRWLRQQKGPMIAIARLNIPTIFVYGGTITGPR